VEHFRHSRIIMISPPPHLPPEGGHQVKLHPAATLHPSKPRFFKFLTLSLSNHQPGWMVPKELGCWVAITLLVFLPAIFRSFQLNCALTICCFHPVIWNRLPCHCYTGF